MRITVDGSHAVAVTGRLVSVRSAISPINAPTPTVTPASLRASEASRNEPSCTT